MRCIVAAAMAAWVSLDFFMQGFHPLMQRVHPGVERFLFFYTCGTVLSFGVHALRF